MSDSSPLEINTDHHGSRPPMRREAIGPKRSLARPLSLSVVDRRSPRLPRRPRVHHLMGRLASSESLQSKHTKRADRRQIAVFSCCRRAPRASARADSRLWKRLICSTLDAHAVARTGGSTNGPVETSHVHRAAARSSRANTSRLPPRPRMGLSAVPFTRQPARPIAESTSATTPSTCSSGSTPSRSDSRAAS